MIAMFSAVPARRLPTPVSEGEDPPAIALCTVRAQSTPFRASGLGTGAERAALEPSERCPTDTCACRLAATNAAADRPMVGPAGSTARPAPGDPHVARPGRDPTGAGALGLLAPAGSRGARAT
jgi:hypothetical protein